MKEPEELLDELSRVMEDLSSRDNSTLEEALAIATSYVEEWSLSLESLEGFYEDDYDTDEIYEGSDTEEENEKE